MTQYFTLQCKRFSRFLPGAFLVALVLLGSLLTVYGVMTRQNEMKANQTVSIGMVGVADDNFLKMGIAALESFDSAGATLTVEEMSQDEATAALSRGDIAAFVVFPENFVDEAMYGHILPLKFVTTTGAVGLVSIFKDEVTDVIASLLLCSQRGVFGMANLLEDQGLITSLGSKMDTMAFEYVEYVLQRDRLYRLDTLGISDTLGMAQYLLCGLFVLFVLLICLPFAPALIHRDYSLNRMLTARGLGSTRQLLGQYLAFLLGLITILAVLTGALLLIPEPPVEPVALFVNLLPVTVMLSAMSFLLYTLATDLIGGVLLQFFITVSMCFVSGCLYPVYFFPAPVQKLAAYLPTGIARSQLSCAITGEPAGSGTWLLLGFAAVFLLLAAVVQKQRIQEATA